ncbi:Na+/H+ antiporter subunit G [Azomonas macrocytogenes]|uniref:Multicomponent K+:H+ antiporter subunit G n=1 Tax=Azomonas macrocytogenes TaxID=69962 RepID=A0A839SZX7_AZOMA|nr:Na+/H+ antiporter subunit G [Azomonas macrocytogenes]MBB3102269.1 multicomponent K+:H+ antiporter subunit G [Azomonas macrocytogenes]
MPFWIELIVSLLLILGSVFALIGALGLYRLPDFFTRLHGPTKATTLGVGSIVIASMVFFSWRNGTPSLHELLITIFLFFTAPVSAHMMAKAAMQQKLPLNDKTQGKPWE